MELIISLVAGALGGNGAGGVVKTLDLGALGNSLAGVVGGGIGGQIFVMLGTGHINAGTAVGDMDIGAVLGQIASGGVGGAILLVIVDVAKNAMGK